MKKINLFLLLCLLCNLVFAQRIRQNRTFNVPTVQSGAGLSSWQASIAMTTCWLTGESFDKNQFLGNTGIWSKFPQAVSSITLSNIEQLKNIGLNRKEVELTNSTIYDMLLTGPVVLSNYVQTNFIVVTGMTFSEKQKEGIIKIVNSENGTIEEKTFAQIHEYVGYSNGQCDRQSVSYFFEGDLAKILLQSRKIGVSFYALSHTAPGETQVFLSSASLAAKYHNGVRFTGKKLLINPINSRYDLAIGFKTAKDIVDTLNKLKIYLNTISPNKKIDFFSISTHGFSTGLNLGSSEIKITGQGVGKLKEFATILDGVLSDDAKVIFYACCTSSGDHNCHVVGKEQPNNDIYGNGSFCDSLEMYINPVSQPNKNRQVWGHFIRAHAYLALQWRVFIKGENQGRDALGSMNTAQGNFNILRSAINGILKLDNKYLANLDDPRDFNVAGLTKFIQFNLVKAPFTPPFVENGQAKPDIVNWFVNEWYRTQ